MVTFRTLALVSALVVAACGNGTDDATTTARAPQGADDVTSTTASQGEGTTSAPEPDETDGTGPATPPDTEPGAPGTAERSEVDDRATSDRNDVDDSVYVPPAGEYLYDVTGHVETTGLTNRREPAPPTSTDQVDISGEPADLRMTVTTRDEGSDSTQDVVVSVTDSEARLVRLGNRPDSGGFAFSVNPDPPALLARLPYRSGDSWEIAWEDPALGISGVGTGTVTGRETVTTPAGTYDSFVITIEQHLRGTINGTLTVTSWIDPITGIQAKQHIVTDVNDATGASRSDTIRVLRRHPAG